MSKHNRINTYFLPSQIRNFCIISHVDHGKTTLSDHLLVSGGMLPQNMAGKLRALDFLEIEQERGITIEDSTASFKLKNDKDEVLVNFIDTPGHIDFSGRVTDALTLVDNGLIIVDAVEGVMAQTITVIRQAINQQLKLFLFINKVDRLITELKFDTTEMRSRIETIIGNVYNICKEYNYRYNIPTFRNGGVIIGSALDGWGVDNENAEIVEGMTGIQQWYNAKLNIPENALLTNVFQRKIIHQFLSAKEAHKTKYQFTRTLDERNKKIKYERNIILAGKKFRKDKVTIASLVRIIQGRISLETELYSSKLQRWLTVEKIEKYRGMRSIQQNMANEGDIVGMVFSDTLPVGDVLRDDEEKMELPKPDYFHEPVISKTIEPVEYAEYDHLVRELELIAELHANVEFVQSEETGELLIFGLGPLQLEIVEKELAENGMNFYTSEPAILSYQIPTEFGKYEIDGIQFQILNPKLINTQGDRIYSDNKNNQIYVTGSGNKINEKGIIETFRNWLNFGYREDLVRNLVLELLINNMEDMTYEESLIQMNKILRKIKKSEILERHHPIFTIKIEINEEYVGNVVQVIEKAKGKVIEISTESSKSKIEAEIPVNTSDIVESLRKETDGKVYWKIEKTKYVKK